MKSNSAMIPTTIVSMASLLELFAEANVKSGDDEEHDADAAGYSELELTARDFARRFTGTAGEDLENAAQALGQAAAKASEIVGRYMR